MNRPYEVFYATENRYIFHQSSEPHDSLKLVSRRTHGRAPLSSFINKRLTLVREPINLVI